MFEYGQTVTHYMVERTFVKARLEKLTKESLPELPITQVKQDILIKYLPLPDEAEFVIPREIHNMDMDVFVGEDLVKNDDYWVPLKKIVLHEDIKLLPPSVFGCCIFLETLVVDPENEYYQTIDGVLYSKDGKTLVCFPAGRNTEIFDVPEGVEVIGENAFQNSFVYRINMPTTLKKVEDDAFWFSYTKVVDFSKSTIETVGQRIFEDVADMAVITKQDCFGQDRPNVSFAKSEEGL